MTSKLWHTQFPSNMISISMHWNFQKTLSLSIAISESSTEAEGGQASSISRIEDFSIDLAPMVTRAFCMSILCCHKEWRGIVGLRLVHWCLAISLKFWQKHVTGTWEVNHQTYGIWGTNWTLSKEHTDFLLSNWDMFYYKCWFSVSNTSGMAFAAANLWVSGSVYVTLETKQNYRKPCGFYHTNCIHTYIR